MAMLRPRTAICCSVECYHSLLCLYFHAS